jgi:hypothetical protein
MTEVMELYETDVVDDGDDPKLASSLAQTGSEAVARKIVIIEYISIVAVTVCLVVSVILATQERSASALALAIDSCLDILSYVVIVWRFSGSEKSSYSKERHSLIVLGALFIISGVVVEYESIRNYVSVVKPRPSRGFILINLAQGSVFTLIGIYKLKLSTLTPLANSLLSDGVNSIISALDCFSMSFSMTVFIMSDRHVWYLDAAFGIIMGLFIVAYGCYLFFQVHQQRKQENFTQLY